MASIVFRQPPRLDIQGNRIVAHGCWRVDMLVIKKAAYTITASIEEVHDPDAVEWDLTQMEGMDYTGAQVLWNGWAHRLPRKLKSTPEQDRFFARLAYAGDLARPVEGTIEGAMSDIPKAIKEIPLGFVQKMIQLSQLLGQLTLDFFRFVGSPQRGPWREISANIFHAGAQALGIIAIVGFLIGVVLSYLSAQQLHMFGGDIFLVDLLGMSVVRELGPLLAAILVAGRSGSAMTAQIGVMRVTEELDAMQVMGLSHGFRLVLPKVMALGLAMPMLIVWTDIVALVGGAFAGKMSIGLSMAYFLSALPDAVPIANFWIGLGKGVVFGVIVAIVACFYGLRIQPNTDSLGQGTTKSVVTSITAVIFADAVFAIVLQGVGF